VSDWIELEERLPEPGVPVLTFNNYGDFAIRVANKNGFHKSRPYAGAKVGWKVVTHWMRLPEDPE